MNSSEDADMAQNSYKVGVARFRKSENAISAALAKLAFAATVNRTGMTDEERKEAFTAFFAKEQDNR